MRKTYRIIASAACACMMGISGVAMAASSCTNSYGTDYNCTGGSCTGTTCTSGNYTAAWTNYGGRCYTTTGSGWIISGCNSGSTGSGSCGTAQRPCGNNKPCQTAAATEAPTQQATAAPTATAKPTSQATAKPTATASTGNGSASTSMAQQVLDIVNQERAAAGLGALTMDANLSAAAEVRAEEITRSFSHTRPDGSSFSTVTSGAYGENIAMGQSSAQRVMAAWMSSSGHRANILNSRYATIGICAYEYNGVMYWVQLFGR